jgi:hypothetical protein
VVIDLPTVLAIRLSMRVVREKIGSKNLKITRMRNGIRKKIDKAHALGLLIVRAHANLMRVLRQLMQRRFLVLLPPMPTIRRSRVMKPGHVLHRAIKNLCGVI